jgi:hypothetical protein
MGPASAWHDGLVEAFPVPRAKPSKLPPKPKIIEEALQALTISQPHHSLPSPFPFLSLPAEIRNRIYSLILARDHPKPLILLPNHRAPTSLFLTSSQIHREASYLFYTSQTFRLFPIQEFKPLPTVAEVPLRYRSLITKVELILGPGWTAPPKSWKVTPRMAKILKQSRQASWLRVFVEVDPSHPIFASFRVSHGFYTEFAGKLLRDVLVAMPQVQCVQLDGNPSVRMEGPLVSRLRAEIEALGRVVEWGKERGGEDEAAKKEVGSGGCDSIAWAAGELRGGEKPVELSAA